MIIFGLNIKLILNHSNILGSESIEKPYLNNLLCRHLAGSLVKTIEKCEPLRQAKVSYSLLQTKLCIMYLMSTN